MESVDVEYVDYQTYLKLKVTHPHLFRDGGRGSIRIIDEPESTNPAVKGVEDDTRRTSGDATVGIVFEDEYVVVIRDPVKFADGRTGCYLRILEKPIDLCGVAVLPVLDGKVALVRHFRHATRSWHLEFPRGFGEAGLTPLQVAEKELAEEIGASAHSLEELGRIHTNTGLLGSEVAVFFANLSSIGKPNRTEGIASTFAVSVEALDRMVADSEITDAITIAAYARAKARKLL